jgi:hypothetical protein
VIDFIGGIVQWSFTFPPESLIMRPTTGALHPGRRRREHRLPADVSIDRVRTGVWRRAAVIVAVVTAGSAVVGCVGGNVFGANPGDGGCGFRPDGLVVEDITGTWEGDGLKITLKLDGTVTGPASLLPPSPSASGRSARPTPSPATVEATGRWALKDETYLGDVEITDVRSAKGPATFGVADLYVSGSRQEPWMYTLGDGDPDSCTIVKYRRTSRG